MRRFARSGPATVDADPASAARSSRAGGTDLDALYDQHASAIERWVRRLGGPAVDVQDLMHDVFVVALRRRDQLRPDGNPRTWLFRITQHVILTRRRRDRVRGWLFARYSRDSAATTSAPDTPSEAMERRQEERHLYAALDRLPEKYRAALILYELEGLSGEEIAELVGERVNAIWVRLHRARARLHALLREDVDR